jgi:hypothetical protein
VRGGFCESSQLGHFILDLPKNITISDTSFYQARIAFGKPASGTNTSVAIAAPSGGFWDNPAGNPVVPPEDAEYTSPWRRDTANPSPSSVLSYTAPIKYAVAKTGYYCVGALRRTSDSNPLLIMNIR